MFLTNLKVFLETLARDGLFTTINVLGLSIGLASCLLISLYVLDEFSYDTKHEDAERIMRISSFLTGVEQERMAIPSASPLAGPLLEQNFPEIEAFSRIAEEPVYLSRGVTGNHEAAVRFVDGNFFDFFQFGWLQGDPATALMQPDSIVLTQSLAEKYFGSEEALGQQLNLQQVGLLKVTGVIDDLHGTHLKADAFVTMPTLARLLEPAVMETWFGDRFQVYVRLQEGVTGTQLQPALHAFLEAQMPPAAKALYDPNSTPLRDIHLSDPQDLGLSGNNRRTEVLSLIAVCASLLVIACINFINLATARSSQRGKEIGVRKAMGARRVQIFFQHISESGMLVLLALLIAIGIAELALPSLNAFSGKQLRLDDRAFLLPVLCLACAVALLAGVYPALHLSAFRPVAVLRSSKARRNGGYSFRDGLVIVQFAIAIVLIVATTVIYQQVQYGKNIELGFDRNRVLVVENLLGDSWSVVKQRWLNEEGVSAVSGAMNAPFKPLATSLSARHEGRPEGENLAFFMADFGYFDLFDVGFVAGRDFEETPGSDRQMQPTEANPHTNAALVLNHAMTEKLGWAPEDAVGKVIELNWSTDYSESIMGEVVGVTENMRVDSLRRDTVPLLYLVPASVSGLSYALIKLSDADTSVVLQRLASIWNEVYPDEPLNWYFLDAAFASVYAAEEAQASLLATFAALAISISCLGLFGLAAFTAQKRGKEVGIRKTFGGSVWSIVILLTNDFSRLVLIANVIAWPVAYFAMQRWLENFAYRIDLTPLVFMGSGFIALCIAWVTVGGTAARAASAKPVLAVRYE